MSRALQRGALDWDGSASREIDSNGGNGAFHHIYVNAAIRVDAGQHVRHWCLYFERVFRILGQAAVLIA